MLSKNLPIEADCTQTIRKSWTEQSNENFIWKYFYKGSISVFFSYPPCKDDNARFTTVPFKALSDQVLRYYNVVVSFPRSSPLTL